MLAVVGPGDAAQPAQPTCSPPIIVQTTRDSPRRHPTALPARGGFDLLPEDHHVLGGRRPGWHPRTPLGAPGCWWSW